MSNASAHVAINEACKSGDIFISILKGSIQARDQNWNAVAGQNGFYGL